MSKDLQYLTDQMMFEELLLGPVAAQANDVVKAPELSRHAKVQFLRELELIASSEEVMHLKTAYKMLYESDVIH